MAVLREKGYEFRGWKLGEKVKSEIGEHFIVGFDERAERAFIAITTNDINATHDNIKTSLCATSYLENDSEYFVWVSENEIEKIENDVEEKNKEVMDKINQYDLESLREKIKKADELAFEEHKKRFGCPLAENHSKVEDNGKNIKPNHYKVNIAGNECEVKDVIKAVVKDYDSFNVGNIIKYVMRYQKKNGLEDLKKARTYLDELIADMEDR